MAGGNELSKIDQTILRYCDSESAEEISHRLGGVITPERVAAQKAILLASKKWLADDEEEELVLYRMRSILAKLEEKFFAENLDSAMVQLRYLKEIAARLDKRREQNQLDLHALYGNQSTIMLRALDLATGYLRGVFRDQIDQQTWNEALLEGARLAQAEIEKHKAVE